LYDIDNCGFIRAKDLKTMLGRLGESRSIDECEVMINKFDLNGDGVLSFEEFMVMMK
jgi:calcium-binding protein CML